MNLNITADMVRELVEHHGRADETGIVLTADGWEVTTWSGRYQDTRLIGMTKDDAYGWADGTELDEDDAEALATSEDYRIPDENGDYLNPGDDAEPQVVTGAWEGRLFDSDDESQGEVEADWRDAWWFDQGKAVELIGEQHREYAEHGTASSLWRTPGGRYVMHTRTIRGGYSESWTELDHAQAAEWGYHAGEYEVNDDVDLPPVIRAARAARTIADALTPPAVPYIDGDFGERLHRADRVQDQAADIVHAAAAVSDLLRLVVAPQLRAHRAAAARVVELAHDGNQTEAAAWLGMGRSTFAKLLPR